MVSVSVMLRVRLKNRAMVRGRVTPDVRRGPCDCERRKLWEEGKAYSDRTRFRFRVRALWSGLRVKVRIRGLGFGLEG